MKKVGKVLIAAAVVGLGVFATAKVVKHHKKKKFHKVKTVKQRAYTTTNYDEEDEEPTIKEKVAEKTIEVLAWAGEHQTEIENATKLAALTGACIEIVVNVRKLHGQSKMKKDIEFLKKNVGDTYRKGWDDAFHKVATMAKETVRLDAEAAKNGDKFGRCLTIFDQGERLDFALQPIPIEAIVE